jgi:GNAT superfamily N-acetyltransferase
MNAYSPILPWALGPDHPRWTETLRDRTRVVIRPIAPADLEAERRFIEALSPQSRRFRFLGEVRHPSEELLVRLTTPDYRRDVAFAAVVPEDAHERFLGVARYSTSPDGLSCECAVAVLDEWHNKGLGTSLMRHLIEVARARGISCMYSVDSAENTGMSDLARFLGFDRALDKQDASLVPGHPASHGCIRLPPAFAASLFDAVDVGDVVVVLREGADPASGSLISPFTASGKPQPLPRLDGDGAYWDDFAQPAGAVTIVASLADRRAQVLRNGVRIAESSLR